MFKGGHWPQWYVRMRYADDGFGPSVVLWNSPVLHFGIHDATARGLLALGVKSLEPSHIFQVSY